MAMSGCVCCQASRDQRPQSFIRDCVCLRLAMVWQHLPMASCPIAITAKRTGIGHAFAVNPFRAHRFAPAGRTAMSRVFPTSIGNCLRPGSHLRVPRAALAYRRPSPDIQIDQVCEMAGLACRTIPGVRLRSGNNVVSPAVLRCAPRTYQPGLTKPVRLSFARWRTFRRCPGPFSRSGRASAVSRKLKLRNSLDRALA